MGDDLRQKVRNMYQVERTTNGIPQHVITQDRTNIYPLYLENLWSEIKENEGIFFGINLYMSMPDQDVLLGTFETVAEVINEINELYNTELEVYCVSGFSPDIEK